MAFVSIFFYKCGIIAIGHKAYILTVALVGGHEVQGGGQGADVGLGPIPQREQDVGQKLAGELPQEIGLILALVGGGIVGGLTASHQAQEHESGQNDSQSLFHGDAPFLLFRNLSHS